MEQPPQSVLFITNYEREKVLSYLRCCSLGSLCNEHTELDSPSISSLYGFFRFKFPVPGSALPDLWFLRSCPGWEPLALGLEPRPNLAVPSDSFLLPEVP